MGDLSSQATKAALKGDWQKAFELNSVIISENHDDIEALNRLAHALHCLGKTQEAKKTYQKTLILDPYNHIALKNLKKLNTLKEPTFEASQPSTSCLFLEEPGKTKVAKAVNPAPQKVLATLSPGNCLNLVIKKHSALIFRNSDYLGALPDDIAHRLINLTRLGNKYEAYVKAVENNNLIIFLQEVKRSKRVGDQPSFPQGGSDGFYPFIHSKQALSIDSTPPAETSLSEETEDELKEEEENEEV